jgi:L-alanine-DL-glutamate epimerase-like enolase superfamily enzyme
MYPEIFPKSGCPGPDGHDHRRHDLCLPSGERGGNEAHRDPAGPLEAALWDIAGQVAGLRAVKIRIGRDDTAAGLATVRAAREAA